MSAPNRPTRRATILSALSLALLPALPLRAQTLPELVVAKDPNCGCCDDWVAILRDAGLSVTVEEMPPADLRRLKARLGVAPQVASCHTGRIAGYVIEGHVPPADIRRLLAERPDAFGLSVPGMPWGSPGMGPEDEREEYAVHLLRRDGTTEVFTLYPAA
jgi:hypothetical protein